MRYSFDDAHAQRRRHVQYYEMLGNRGIWRDGWKAVANHVDTLDFDQDKWELYNTDKDFSESHDLAEQHPEKLKELINLWWHEAGHIRRTADAGKPFHQTGTVLISTECCVLLRLNINLISYFTLKWTSTAPHRVWAINRSHSWSWPIIEKETRACWFLLA